MTEFPKKSESTQPQNDFLAKPVALISAVQRVGEVPVSLAVLRYIRVQQIDGHNVAIDADHVVLPRPNPNLALFELDRNSSLHLLQDALGFPLLRLLRLVAGGIKQLPEITLAIDQGHSHDRGAQIGSRPKSVAGQHPQTAAVGRHVGVERDLHGKICDGGWLNPWLHKADISAQISFYAARRAMLA